MLRIMGENSSIILVQLSSAVAKRVLSLFSNYFSKLQISSLEDVQLSVMLQSIKRMIGFKNI